MLVLSFFCFRWRQIKNAAPAAAVTPTSATPVLIPACAPGLRELATSVGDSLGMVLVLILAPVSLVLVPVLVLLLDPVVVVDIDTIEDNVSTDCAPHRR